MSCNNNNRNNECNKVCLTNKEVFTKEQIKTLVENGGLAPDIGKILGNLSFEELTTQSKFLVGAIIELTKNLDKKVDKSPVMNYLATLTAEQISEVIQKVVV